MFCAHNFEQIKNYFLSFDDESAALKIGKECISDENLPQQLAFIRVHFTALTFAIKELITSEMLLTNAFKVTEKVAENLKSVPGAIGEKLVTKLEHVLNRNPGYDKIKNICTVLRGVSVENFLFKYKSNQFHLLLVMCSKSTNQIKITLKTSHGTLSLLSLLSIKENTFWSALILWPAMSLPCYAHDSCHIDKKFSFQISRDNETQQLMTISSSTLL